MEETTVRAALSRSPPGALERKVALGVIVVSAFTLIVVTPFARLPLPRSNAFIPLYQCALIVTDLITAVLLFGQFAQLRHGDFLFWRPVICSMPSLSFRIP